MFSNALPAGATLVSASASQGTIGLLNGAVLGNLGSLAVGSSATVTITLSPSSLEVTPGGFTNVASVSATEIDLNPFNNTAATITQLSVPVTDIALTQSLAPVPAVAGYLVTNTLVVTNLGPGLALNVGLSSWLPTNALFVTAIATNGSWQTNGGLFTCEFGNVPVSASVSAFIVLSPLATSVSESGANAPLVSIVSATTASSDVNLTNNSVTNIVVVTTPSPTLQPAGAALISEIGTVNGAIDIGDTVTVALAITNSGTADTSTNLTATLQSSGGIIPDGEASRVYGVIAHGGSAVANPFTFTVNAAAPAVAPPANGGSILATLLLQDIQSLGSGLTITNSYVVTFPFLLPTGTTQTNISTIIIPNVGTATPYPSVLTVSGMTGVVSKATVTLNGVSHTYPSDIDVLLVSPAGQAVALMANAGANNGIVDTSISFDDAAAAPLPQFAPITSGTYLPTVFGPLTSLPSPAPPAPYASALAAVDGANPNGNWSLYVYDSKVGNSGFIAEGWTLGLTMVTPLMPAVQGLQIQRLASGSYQLVLNGVPETTYVLEVSSDLMSWTAISTNTASGIPAVFVVEPQVSSRAFYRAVAQP